MAKSEILMWVAGILMMIILGLAVAPTITKSGDTAKVAVVNGEIQTLRQSANLWLASNSTDGTFTGLTTTGIQLYIPGMYLDATNELISKANSSISYTIMPKSGDATQITITVEGLTAITGAEASIRTSQTQNASGVRDNDATDGTLIFDFRG